MSREFTNAPSLDDIEAIARTAFEALPDAFRILTTGIVFRVDEFPDQETVVEMGLQSPFDLMGLYSGVPVGEKDAGTHPVVDMIFLYRRPLLDYWCETGEDLSHLVRHVQDAKPAHRASQANRRRRLRYRLLCCRRHATV